VSQLAEFARTLHESSAKRYPRDLLPVEYPSNSDKLTGIRAVIFDIYGTLVNYWRPGLDDAEQRPHIFRAAFREVADRFGFTPFLVEMNPEEEPEKTLYDLYHGLIALGNEKAVKKSIAFPEVKVEEIWGLILLMLKRRGYDATMFLPGQADDLPRYCAFCYNFYSLGRELYPGVVESLRTLKQNNLVLGIVSNAQFTAPIDLTLFIRDQSKGGYEDLLEVFDDDLCFFSYEYGVAKPNTLLLERLYDALYEYQILPEQTVFIGNDLTLDIEPAAKAGMRTALFTGDTSSAYFHDKKGVVVPDIVFQSWDELPRNVSFFSEGASA
jgi:putative hydrolase of the HAD superfamily